MEFLFQVLSEKNGSTTRLSADWRLLYDNSLNTAILAVILALLFFVLTVCSAKKKDTSAKKFYGVMTVACLLIAGVAYLFTKKLAG